MTKPDDIPQDVWDVAYGKALLFVQWLVPAPTDYVQAEHVLAVSFARAIMAAKAEELSACVSIVQEVGTEWGALEAKQACEEAVFLMLGRSD